MTDEKYLEVIRELTVIPAKIKKILISNPKIAELSRIFTYAHNFLYLGRGYSFPVALEGALKLKEISYIHAEGYPAAEMKHGPIALIDAEMPVVVVATHNAMYEKIMSNIQEIKARKGKVIALVTEGDTVISKLADDCIEFARNIRVPRTVDSYDPLTVIGLPCSHLQREKCGSATKSGEVGNSRIEGNAAGDYAGSSRKFPA